MRHKWKPSGIVRQYLFNQLLALDQWANVLLGGFADESISGRLGRALETGKPKWFVKPFAAAVDFVALRVFGEADHVKNAIETEEDTSQEVWHWYKK